MSPSQPSEPRVLFHHQFRKKRRPRKRRVPRAPELSIPQILAWADAHYQRTGAWPKLLDGAIAEAPGETWAAVHAALRQGLRGLPAGSTLARLLAAHRGVRNIQDLPDLTVPQILRWADAHHQRTGRWPKRDSGPIVAVAGETWSSVDTALRHGRRNLPGRSSLVQLLRAAGRMGDT